MLEAKDEAGLLGWCDRSKGLIAATALSVLTASLFLLRSGPLASGGGWYFQSVNDIVKDDSDYLVALDVLAQDVGVAGVFSDWPATVTYYANCMGL